jgi:hypothetical protein
MVLRPSLCPYVKRRYATSTSLPRVLFRSYLHSNPRLVLFATSCVTCVYLLLDRHMYPLFPSLITFNRVFQSCMQGNSLVAVAEPLCLPYKYKAHGACTV